MPKSIFTIIFVLGVLIFVTSTNFKFSSETGNTITMVSDSTRFSRPHDVFPNNVNTSPIQRPFPPNSYEVLTYTNVDISNNTAPQNEPSVKISKKNPNRVVAAWRDFRLGVDPNAVRRVGYSYSTDGGVTWSVSALLDSTLLPGGLLRNSDPSVATDTAGNFYISTIALNNSDGNGTVGVYKSTDGGVTFPIAVIAAQTGSEDKEYITCDHTPGSPYKNNLYISWTRFSGNYGIKCMRSTNSGLNWSAAVNVSTSSTQGQGSDPAVGANGELYVVWIGGASDDIQWFSKSTDGGLTFSTPANIAEGPTPIVPWSQTGNLTFPSIATDISGGPRSGNIYVVWSDARNGDADVFLTRSTDHGSTWSSAARVNDDGLGNGKVQTWPWIGVNDSGNIAIVYFDTRNTPNNNTIEAWLATSTNGGLTFVNSVLSTVQSPTNTPGTNVRFGDYIGIDYWSNHIVPVWTDERAGGYDMSIYTAVVTPTEQHDIAVGPFLSLPPQFLTNNAYNIKTRIANIGSTNETNIPIQWFINGVLTNTTNKSLNAGTVDSVSNTWTPVNPGNYTLMYVSALSNDPNRLNDTVRTIVTVTSSLPPLCEAFNGSTFPPAGWSVVFTGTDYWSQATVSAWCLGTKSAQFDFYDAINGTQQTLVTKEFLHTTGNTDSLVFMDAYATYSTENDQLLISSSTDNGITWVPLATLNGGVSGELVTAPPTTNPFVPTCTQWKRQVKAVPIGTDKLQFTAISAFGNNLYIDSICVVGLIGISPISDLIPKVYSLSQNYPNPFNPTTVIKYGLPKQGLVKLTIYDILGREVKMLVNEVKPAGIYNVSFDGSSLASGIYFYRLEAGDFKEVKKMVLVK